METPVCLKILYESRGAENACECPLCRREKIVPVEVFAREGCTRCHALIAALKGACNVPLQIVVFDVESPDGLAMLAWRESVGLAEEKGLPVVCIPNWGQAVAGDEALAAFGINRPHPDPLPEGEGDGKGACNAPLPTAEENVGAIHESPSCNDKSCALPG